MAKKTAVKKPKRRLRRTARRSLAAVLMITAVVVAAIPVPENAAATENPGISVRAAEPAAYLYPEDPKNGKSPFADICENKSLKNPYPLDSDGRPDITQAPSKDVQKANVVTLLSDGKYQLDWQFEFFMTKVNNNDRGIICNYNNTYQQEEVTLNPNVIYEYDIIKAATYDKFYEENAVNPDDPTQFGGHEYIVSGEPNAEDENDQFMMEYFKSSYDEYVRLYTAYKTALDAWNKDPNHVQENKPTAPPDLKKKVRDLLPDQRLKFYCDRHNNLKGCSLVEVIDSANPNPDGSNSRVYIPKLLPGEAKGEGRYFDDQSLKYISDASIIGIGDQAFMYKENVNKLVIPKEMAYIGKSAFEHSFIKEIAFVNVAQVGDRAFKNCTQLTKIDFGASPTTVKLGTESF